MTLVLSSGLKQRISPCLSNQPKHKQNFSQFRFLILVCGLSWLYLIKLAPSCLSRETAPANLGQSGQTKVKKWEIQLYNFHALNYCSKLCWKISTLMKLEESLVNFVKYIISTHINKEIRQRSEMSKYFKSKGVKINNLVDQPNFF